MTNPSQVNIPKRCKSTASKRVQSHEGHTMWSLMIWLDLDRIQNTMGINGLAALWHCFESWSSGVCNHYSSKEQFNKIRQAAEKKITRLSCESQNAQPGLLSFMVIHHTSATEMGHGSPRGQDLFPQKTVSSHNLTLKAQKDSFSLTFWK